MAQFSVNAQRFDPYKNFKFRVKWDGRYVAGLSKVSAIKVSTEVAPSPSCSPALGLIQNTDHDIITTMIRGTISFHT